MNKTSFYTLFLKGMFSLLFEVRILATGENIQELGNNSSHAPFVALTPMSFSVVCSCNGQRTVSYVQVCLTIEPKKDHTFFNSQH